MGDIYSCMSVSRAVSEAALGAKRKLYGKKEGLLDANKRWRSVRTARGWGVEALVG